MSKKNQKHTDEDAAAMLSVLTSNLAAICSRSSAVEPLAVLNELHAAVDDDYMLQLTVIRRTRVTWWNWVNRPWCTKKLVDFQKGQFREGKWLKPDRLTESELRALFRAATMVRYGIAVDHKYFRALRGLVVDGELTERQLKCLLNFPTVWWGTAVRPSVADGVLLRVLKRFWAMGRPQAGRLMITRFHRVTRMLLWGLLTLAIGTLLLVVYAAVTTVIQDGLTPAIAVFSWAAGQLAFLIAYLQWLGPSADRAARFLALKVTVD